MVLVMMHEDILWNRYKCYNVNAGIFSYRVSFLWYTRSRTYSVEAK